MRLLMLLNIPFGILLLTYLLKFIRQNFKVVFK